MQTPLRNSRSMNDSPARRLIGSTSNILLLGFLAGVFAGYSMPAAAMTWLARLTLAGFSLSVIFTMTKAIRQNRAERRAVELAKWEIERRMEQLILNRRVITHSTHSHRPHKRDEVEHERIFTGHSARRTRMTR